MYKRRLAPWERMLNMSPYSVVSIVARIKGKVTTKMVENAVKKVQQRHILLQTRIIVDENNNPWFTAQDVGKIPIETMNRENNNTWIEVYDEACKVPFEFDKLPAIRFYLLHSEDVSDLLIFCHHVICDGMSLAYFSRDLMKHLGDPNLEVDILPNPLPINRKTIPEEQKLSGLILNVMGKINDKWEPEKIVFDQEDYKNIHKTYWDNFTHQTISIELTEQQTIKLVDNCKANNVSVNSAINTAFFAISKETIPYALIR